LFLIIGSRTCHLDPAKYEQYLKKNQHEISKKQRDKLQKDMGKRHPDAMACEKKKHVLELPRARQRKYKHNLKLNSMLYSNKNVVFKPELKKVTRKTLQSKREYNRLMKQKQRANMTPQKIAWERKKDRERKAATKAKIMSRPNSSISTPESCSTTPFTSKKTEWNIM